MYLFTLNVRIQNAEWLFRITHASALQRHCYDFRNSAIVGERLSAAVRGSFARPERYSKITAYSSDSSVYIGVTRGEKRSRFLTRNQGRCVTDENRRVKVTNTVNIYQQDKQFSRTSPPVCATEQSTYDRSPFAECLHYIASGCTELVHLSSSSKFQRKIM